MVNSKLLEDSRSQEGAMGALTWAVLEMFKRAGMPDDRLNELFREMLQYFPRPANWECNEILRVLEHRLSLDKCSEHHWYEE